MEEAGEDIGYEMFSDPKGMIVPMGISLLGIIGLAIGSRYIGPNITETTPQQALVERCLGIEEEGTSHKAFATVLLDDFASANGWKYDSDMDRFYKGKDVVQQSMIRHASNNYECVVRRTQHR